MVSPGEGYSRKPYPAETSCYGFHAKCSKSGLHIGLADTLPFVGVRKKAYISPTLFLLNCFCFGISLRY